MDLYDAFSFFIVISAACPSDFLCPLRLMMLLPDHQALMLLGGPAG